MSEADRVREAARVPLALLGLELADVSVTPAGRRRVVRVLVDRSLTGIAADDHMSVVPPVDLDEVTDASHAVSQALDATGAMGETPYVLEVSSPGVDRPLRTPAQFRRNVGRLVTVAGLHGQWHGRLRAVSPDSLQLVVEPPGHDVTLAWVDVDHARVHVEFTRPGDTDEEG
jgi:ribosome maturation factor RimP